MNKTNFKDILKYLLKMKVRSSQSGDFKINVTAFLLPSKTQHIISTVILKTLCS